MRNILVLFCALCIAPSLFGQAIPEKTKPKAFEKKLIWGFTFQHCWSTIKGSSLASPYFAKPSLGISANAEYYLLPFLGIGFGAGYQQRGAGIPYPSTQSTTERLRFNTVEFPIAATLRTPRDLIKGFRLSGSVALVPMVNLSSRVVYNDLQPSVGNTDGVQNESAAYFKSDMAYQFSAGPEINAGGTGILKIQFMYSQGTANVYKAGQGTGHNQAAGVRLAFLF